MQLFLKNIELRQFFFCASIFLSIVRSPLFSDERGCTSHDCDPTKFFLMWDPREARAYVPGVVSNKIFHAIGFERLDQTQAIELKYDEATGEVSVFSRTPAEKIILGTIPQQPRSLDDIAGALLPLTFHSSIQIERQIPEGSTNPRYVFHLSSASKCIRLLLFIH